MNLWVDSHFTGVTEKGLEREEEGSLGGSKPSEGCIGRICLAPESFPPLLPGCCEESGSALIQGPANLTLNQEPFFL